jgi:hypothetical protein
MINENKRYTSLINEIENIKNKALNTIISIGKHKGETFEEVMSYDIQYIYWLIRETNLNIDPRIIGLKMPTKDSILKLLESTFEDGKFIYHKRIVYPAQYDNWNLGHYGCSSPECIKEERIEEYNITYSLDKLLNTDRIEILKRAYPYIKWTKEYLSSFFN